MKYKYQARSKEGKIESGIIEASSKQTAVELLSKYNVFVTSLEEEKGLKSINISFFNKVSQKELAVFSRQLSVMLSSRVPVVKSLSSLSEQTKKQYFKEKILKIAQLVDEGSSLSEAFSVYPDIFNAFYVSLIKSGEASGKISETLDYLSRHLEREADINAQIKNAMIYPAFVISVLAVVMIIVVIFVMPKLIDLISESLTQPPFFTRLMLSAYAMLASYWWLLIIIILSVVGSGFYYFKTEAGKKFFDIYSLKVPLLGEFFKKTYLTRFAENLSTLISSGLPITVALKITKDTIESFVYKQIIAEVEKNVAEGEKISDVFKRHPKQVSGFVVQMIQVGEDTGNLDKNLLEIVNFYEKEIKRDVELFTSLLEPILIIFLGICVAFLAVSVLSPLYSTLGTI